MRVDISHIIRDPKLKKELIVQTIIATQAREGIVTTEIDAEKAYEKINLGIDKKMKVQYSLIRKLRAKVYINLSIFYNVEKEQDDTVAFNPGMLSFYGIATILNETI